MTTNLLIAYPQITTGLVASINGMSLADPRALPYNAISGFRNTFTQLASAASAYSYDFDIGSSASRLIEYLILARADIAKAQGATNVKLYGSNDGSTFTAIVGTTALGSATLYSPQ